MLKRELKITRRKGTGSDGAQLHNVTLLYLSVMQLFHEKDICRLLNGDVGGDYFSIIS
jgi:hypothetical protein